MTFLGEKFIYFFVLGHNPALSAEEVFSYFLSKNLSFKVLAISPEILLLELSKEIKSDFVLSQLGGTIKIGRIFYFSKNKKDFSSSLLAGLLETKGNKVVFGISVYKIEKEAIAYSKKLVKDIAMQLKKFLKEENRLVRWVSSSRNPLSSVIVEKNHLLEKGGEIILLSGKNGDYLGKTLSLQEFADYSFRDYHRPFRDISLGMIPPKLAKMMINFSQLKKDEIILDPFCGSGTILQEAILMGFNHLFGADKDNFALKRTAENLEWLFQNYSLKKRKVKLINSPVEKLSLKIKNNFLNAIITEPYLGPTKIKEGVIKKIVKELSLMYLKAFVEFYKILKKEGKVIIIFPIFSFKNKKVFLPIIEQIKKIGFRQERPLVLKYKEIFKDDISSRKTLIYHRPNQHVLREIIFWTKF